MTDPSPAGKEALQLQPEWCRVTLASIGDAVITTDTAGRVTSLNPVAESLTGWSQAEANGQPLGTLFRTLNGQSRHAVEDPALPALREGHVGGLVKDPPPAARRTLGYETAEVIGRDLADLIIPPAVRDRHRQGMARYLATGEGRLLDRRVEMTARRADGTEFPAEFAITRIPTDGPPQFTA